MKEGTFGHLLKSKILGAPLGSAAVFFVVGILFWGAYNTAMEATNTLEFCVSCHEMDQAVYPEYQQTVHYQNRSGVRAICSDCHVPRPWVHKFVRKIQATKELWYWMLGTVDTLEEFEAKRLTMAKKVWKAMKDTDSRECRNCHAWRAMTDKRQKRRAWKQHTDAKKDGLTCIDCHKGIAHRPIHKLLADEEDPYDGQADDRALPVVEDPGAEMAKFVQQPTKVAEAPAVSEAPVSAGTDSTGVDWASVEGKDIPVFFPGQTSFEWVFKGSDHGGARALKKIQDPCAECHEGEQIEMGAKIVDGSKAEDPAFVIPDKRPGFAVNVKAAHDGANLYMHFRWPDTAHTPAPFVDGGKMDPENQSKLAVMIDDDKSEHASYAGCWVTCHHDSRYMPDHPKAAAGDAASRLDVSHGITKYTVDSRTELEIRGNEGPRGGWDKLKPAADIDAMKAAGTFMDLSRWLSSGKSEAGYVLDQRVLAPSEKIKYEGGLRDGQWVVTMTRPLNMGSPGFVNIEAGNVYTLGFAIHDDYSFARFHHVSLEYKLGLDNPEAGINAAKK